MHAHSMDKKTKQKKEHLLEKMSTLTPALGILLLSYLSIPRNKPRIFPLLGNKCSQFYMLSVLSCLARCVLPKIYL